MSWSQEQVLQLIDLYKARPCLYAVKTTEYKNKHMKLTAYQEIEQGLQSLRPKTTTGEIKSKINGLRTNFLTEHRKYKSSLNSGAGAEEVYYPTLWYYEHMLFIIDHTNPRPAVDSIATQQTAEDNSQVYYDEESDTFFQDDDQFQIEYVDEGVSDTPVSGSSTPILSTHSVSQQPHNVNNKRKRKMDDASLITTANDTMGKLAVAIGDIATQRTHNKPSQSAHRCLKGIQKMSVADIYNV
ncbi:uncharacterized protein LOC116165884 [Photinus pyralis]|uniref:uncharacterized protein LOC116165884 n=1 Tax=Photinus pyralis TaxID=7054 RepID=UPI0012670D3A|nr:uncharacterized protein LOC116165884 [Photinus pyralis]